MVKFKTAFYTDKTAAVRNAFKKLCFCASREHMSRIDKASHT